MARGLHAAAQTMDVWVEGTDGSRGADADASSYTPLYWVGYGVLGVVLFAPVGWGAQRALPPVLCAHTAMVRPPSPAALCCPARRLKRLGHGRCWRRSSSAPAPYWSAAICSAIRSTL